VLRTDVAKFVEYFLPKEVTKPEKTKFVHDPLWGTVELRDYEQCILDTPLLQRLRQIHQTGFVYATYPCASHTRFEHTLGVMHLAGRMGEVLHKRFPKVVPATTEQRVRLAGLLHDVGHSAFSHTSEEVYKNCADLAALTSNGGEFEDKGGGEVLSYLIVTSKPFREFFAKVKGVCPELKTTINEFAPFLLAKRSHPKREFEAEIMSSALDADKLDYFPRDGRSVGVELALDIERLLHCLEVAHVKDDVGHKTNVIVVRRGGFNAVQQLLFARATLFSSVYHHHKVRACDCMIKACFERFRDDGLLFKRNKGFHGVALRSAAHYLYITDVDFFAEAYSHRSDSVEHKLIHDVLYRRLLKRVLTISARTIPGFEKDAQKAAYDTFYNLRSDGGELRKLAVRVHKRARVVCSRHSVWFDIPGSPSFLKKVGSARINEASAGAKPIIKKLSAFIPLKEWVDTYNQYNAESFLFGPPEPVYRIKLACAALRVLRDDYQLKLSKESLPQDIRNQVVVRMGKYF